MHATEAPGRCVWIDAAKGIGIGLVVLGHMNIPEPVRQYLYCFHIPLFFFLSGLLHHRRPLRALVVRRARTLLVPYVLFSIIGFALYSLMGTYQAGDYTRALAGIAYGTVWHAYGVPVQPQWFLLCLFATEIAFGLILFMVRGRRLMMLIPMTAMTTVGFINSRTLRVVLPWGMTTSLVAVLFYYLGDCFREVAPVFLTMKAKAKVAGAILLGVIVFITARVNGRVDMVYNQYRSIPVFLLGAMAGAGMTVLLSMLTERVYRGGKPVAVSGAILRSPSAQWLTRLAAGVTTCLLYAGRNTLIILPMHVLVSRVTAHYLAMFSFTSSAALYELIEKSITVLLLVASIEIFRRCPLVVPRARSRVATDLLGRRRDWHGSTPVLAGYSSQSVAEARNGGPRLSL